MDISLNLGRALLCAALAAALLVGGPSADAQVTSSASPANDPLLVGALVEAEERLAALTAGRSAAEEALEQREGALDEADAALASAVKVVDRARDTLRRAEQRTTTAKAQALVDGQRTARMSEVLEGEQQELTDVVVELYKSGGDAARLTASIDALTAARGPTDFIVAVQRLQMGVGSQRADVEELAGWTRDQQEQQKTSLATVELRAEQQHVAEALLGEAVGRQRHARERVDEAARHRREALDDLQRIEEDHVRQQAEVDELEEAAAEVRNTRWRAGWLGSSGLIWPTDGAVTSGFGLRKHPVLGKVKRHTGLDIPAPTGQVIVAADAGAVSTAGSRGGYGIAVEINHGNGVSTLYAHTSRLLVRAGAHVRQGQPIALVGSTGMSTGPHLHFEVRSGGAPRDPMAWFNGSTR